ncbi:hypothetical protein Tco_0041278 [Tanacetum coccineum]
MKRPTKGYTGIEVELFPTMLNVLSPESSPAPSSSPSRITSSPSHSSEPSTKPKTSKPQPTQSLPTAEEHVPTPRDSPLHSVPTHGSDEGSLQLFELTNLVTKLSDKIEVLETDLQKTKKTYKADEEVHDKASEETELIIQEETPTEVVQDQGSREKGQPEVSTTDIPVSTASATTGTASVIPTVSTVNVNVSTTSTIHSEVSTASTIRSEVSTARRVVNVSTASVISTVSTVNVNFSTANTVRNEVSTAGRVVYSGGVSR